MKSTKQIIETLPQIKLQPFLRYFPPIPAAFGEPHVSKSISETEAKLKLTCLATKTFHLEKGDRLEIFLIAFFLNGQFRIVAMGGLHKYLDFAAAEKIGVGTKPN